MLGIQGVLTGLMSSWLKVGVGNENAGVVLLLLSLESLQATRLIRNKRPYRAGDIRRVGQVFIAEKRIKRCSQ